MSHSYRLVGLTLVLPIALLAAGCGSSTPNPPGSTDVVQPTRATDDDGGPAPLTDSVPPSTPAPVVMTPVDGERERVARWTSAGQLDGGRRLQLDVAIGGPPCDTVTGLDVSETGTAVTVTVHAGRTAGADCTDALTGALATARVEVELKQPLGERELLGGGA